MGIRELLERTEHCVARSIETLKRVQCGNHEAHTTLERSRKLLAAQQRWNAEPPFVVELGQHVQPWSLTEGTLLRASALTVEVSGIEARG